MIEPTLKPTEHTQADEFVAGGVAQTSQSVVLVNSPAVRGSDAIRSEVHISEAPVALVDDDEKELLFSPPNKFDTNFAFVSDDENEAKVEDARQRRFRRSQERFRRLQKDSAGTASLTRGGMLFRV